MAGKGDGDGDGELHEHRGSCHCAAVRFSVWLPRAVEAERCDCSICAKSGFVGIIVPARHLQVHSGQATLTEYRFNTGVACHTFCRLCGVKPFYTPRSNPDGKSINLACLDIKPQRVDVVDFHGIQWEKHAHKLAHKSRPAA